MSQGIAELAYLYHFLGFFPAKLSLFGGITGVGIMIE